MDSLYRSLPKQYVEALLNGDILFRNLVYFRMIEGDPRTDIHEGWHVDRPKHPVQIEIVGTTRIIEGDFAFHNNIMHPERIFCFCTSMKHDPSHSKFGDACIEILNPVLLTKRLRTALLRRGRLTRLADPVLLARPVSYYRVDEEAPAEINMKDPRDIPFAKRESYSDECEFRFVFARRGGYELLQQLVTADGGAVDMAGKPQSEMLIKIGSIRDIAREII
jgi:hypothetical protein